MSTRRDFLKASSLLALAPSIPGFLERAARAAEPGKDRRILVVIQLDGGNDGINTVVPFRDEGYARHRNKLRLPTDRLHKLADDVALHPAMRAAADLVEDGRLGIVQGVSYPNPNRSHDVSMSIWHTARFDRAEHKSYGWIGRALDAAASERKRASAMFIGDGQLPQAVIGRRSAASALSSLDDLSLRHALWPGLPTRPLPRTKVSPPSHSQAARRRGDLRSAVSAGSGDPRRARESASLTLSTRGDLAEFVRRTALDAYATADLLQEVGQRDATGERYPDTELAGRLQLIARLIKAELPARVYYAVQPGYDTHAVQLPRHERLLREFSGALKAFLDDLRQARLDERVVVMAFSEFGRRVAENASQGTDHGTAGPVFVGGPSVKAGLIGETPSPQHLQDGDLKVSVDFRRVYAAILQDWLRIRPEASLGGRFDPLTLFARS